MSFFPKHDPADREHCSYCGIAEDIHLLDGVLTDSGEDTGKLACVACYPDPGGWDPVSLHHIDISIAPSLKPLYDQYLSSVRWLRRSA